MIFAVVIAVVFPDQMAKLIFIPLVIYAAYGLKQNLSRLLRRKRRDDEDADPQEAYRPKR
ncbi:hypothetical protein D3C73_1628620 [compost metagenome]